MAADGDESMLEPHRPIDSLPITAAAEGDQQATYRLLSAIRPIAVRYCRARLGGLDRSFISADDVAQEVCLAVLKALPSYRDEGRPFMAFVYGIAAHKVADAFRAAARNRAEPVSELPDRPATGDGPEGSVLAGELNGYMSEMLATLPLRLREVVVLRVVVGLSTEETANALGMTPNVVRKTQHRALAQLRYRLAGDLDGHRGA